MAYSIVQRRAAAIAKHEPEKLYKRNRGLLSMTESQMSDFASTKERGLPYRSSLSKRKRGDKKHA